MSQTDPKTDQCINLCLHHVLKQMEQVTSNSTNLLQLQHILEKDNACTQP